MELFGLGSGSIKMDPELSGLTSLDTLRFLGCWLKHLPAELAGMKVGWVRLGLLDASELVDTGARGWGS